MRALAATSNLAILLAGGASAAAPTKIVFQSIRFGGAGYDLYVVNPDGSGFARVPGPSSWRSVPSWSPSGSTIAYVVRAKHGSSCKGSGPPAADRPRSASRRTRSWGAIRPGRRTAP